MYWTLNLHIYKLGPSYEWPREVTRIPYLFFVISAPAGKTDYAKTTQVTSFLYLLHM